jgi:hypothetical protein
MPDAKGVKKGSRATAIVMTKFLRFIRSRNSHFLSKPLQKNRGTEGVTVRYRVWSASAKTMAIDIVQFPRQKAREIKSLFLCFFF